MLQFVLINVNFECRQQIVVYFGQSSVCQLSGIFTFSHA